VRFDIVMNLLQNENAKTNRRQKLCQETAGYLQLGKENRSVREWYRFSCSLTCVEP